MKVLDINFMRSYNKEHNECDINEFLFCINAWHEMIIPGHHHIALFGDGSGAVEYAVNSPEIYGLHYWEIEPIIRFSNMKDFISKIMEALEEAGFKITDDTCVGAGI